MEGRSTEVNVLLPRMAKMADHNRENEIVDGTPHPGQNLTLLCVVLYSKQVSKVTIEYAGIPTKTTKGRKY